MKEYCVDLEIAKELKKNGFPQNSIYNHINSSYNTGMEGESIYWLCDNKWSVLDFAPNSEYHDTGKVTKEDGLIPDFCNFRDYRSTDQYKNYRKHAIQKIEQLLVYSAPITDEILKELPSDINGYVLEIIRYENETIEADYIRYLQHEEGKEYLIKSHKLFYKLSDCLGELWIDLKKEGYIK